MAYAPFDLTGKTALVTGGNRGIGYGMAEALAASNANVAIWGRKADANEKAVAALKYLGAGDVKAWTVDVADEAAVVKAMAETNDWNGRIDSVIANAGVGFGASSFHEMDTETYRKNMSVNLDGAFWTLREGAKYMVARAKAGQPGGSLVGVASLAAIEGAAKNRGLWCKQKAA
jgi:Dehydrogenases with different specificities (related to short-chain alcohol dehydrogenases)